MLRKTLSQTLNSEIESYEPYNKSLLSYKRWADNLNPPFNKYAYKFLHKFMEWYYEKPIQLHMKSLDEQVEIVRREYGSDDLKKSSKTDEKYVWDGQGDWHQ